MTTLPFYMNFTYAFIATMGFSVFFNAPKYTLFPCGFIGSIGWVVFFYLNEITQNNILANFVAALLVSYISEIFARKLKYPAIIFSIPGIIPLVPGLGMYNTMLYLIQGNYNDAVSKGSDVLFVGGAISLGILIITSLIRTLHLISIRKIFK